MSQHQWTGDDNERAIPKLPAPRRPEFYDPLHDLEARPVLVRSVGDELQLAHRLLDEVAAANIHDPDAMIRVAAGLHYRMRALVAALDAERGERS